MNGTAVPDVIKAEKNDAFEICGEHRQHLKLAAWSLTSKRPADRRPIMVRLAGSR